MITIQQIKAARALLNWNQEDLASAAKVSKPAIANLERGTAMPRMETQNAITRALEEAGVEFTDGPGVRLRGEILKVEVFEGQNAIYRLWDDQFETLKSSGGERLFCGIDERITDKAVGKYDFQKNMERFKSHDITSRLLLLDGDTFFVEPVSHYRWVSEDLFSQVPYFVYGNKYGMLLWEPAQKIIIIENKAIADSYRKQFNVLWGNAKIPVVKS